MKPQLLFAVSVAVLSIVANTYNVRADPITREYVESPDAFRLTVTHGPITFGDIRSNDHAHVAELGSLWESRNPHPGGLTESPGLTLFFYNNPAFTGGIDSVQTHVEPHHSESPQDFVHFHALVGQPDSNLPSDEVKGNYQFTQQSFFTQEGKEITSFSTILTGTRLDTGGGPVTGAPEPFTLLLYGTGVAGIILFGRKRLAGMRG